AVDFACLAALVAWRRAHGLPAPVAESARDREEFARSVRAFLERLRDAIAVGLTSEQRAKLDAAAHAGGDPTERLLTVQVALAKSCRTTGCGSRRAAPPTSAGSRSQAASAAAFSAGSSAAVERHAASAHRFSTSSSARRHRPYPSMSAARTAARLSSASSSRALSVGL